MPSQKEVTSPLDVVVSESLVAACGTSFADLTRQRPPGTVQLVEPHAFPRDTLRSFSVFACKKVVRGKSEEKKASDAGKSEYARCHDAGEHVALSLVPQPSSSQTDAAAQRVGGIHVVVLRCDTYAVEWAVALPSAFTGPDVRISQLLLLDANTVVFVATTKAGSTLFVGRRSDVEVGTKNSNRAWRLFTAEAVEVAIAQLKASESIVSIAPANSNSIAVATSSGSLLLVAVQSGSVSSPRVVAEKQSFAAAFAGKTGAKSSAAASPQLRLVVCSTAAEDIAQPNSEGEMPLASPTLLAWHCSAESGNNSCTIVNVADGSSAVIALGAAERIKDITFMGSDMVLLTSTSDNVAHAFNFVRVSNSDATESTPSKGKKSSAKASSEQGFSATKVKTVPFPWKNYRPVASSYVNNQQIHLIFALPTQGLGVVGASTVESECLEALVCAAVPMPDGAPYNEEQLRAAVWSRRCDLQRLSQDGSGFAAFRKQRAAALDQKKFATGAAAALLYHRPQFGTLDLAETGNTQADQDMTTSAAADVDEQERVQNSQLTLYYALASSSANTNNMDEAHTDKVENGTAMNVAVFAITTAPYLHSRLVKQWHNAGKGLKTLFVRAIQGNPGLVSPFLRQWNPAHLTRALRLLSQQELHAAFHAISVMLKEGGGAASPQESSGAPCAYGVLSTSAVDIAAHIITLSRSSGVAIDKADVEQVLLLLRSARQLAHHLQRRTARMSMLLDASFQLRAYLRLMSRDAAALPEDKPDVLYGSNAILHIPAVVRLQRRLHARYTMNSWAQGGTSTATADSASQTDSSDVANAALQLLQEAGCDGAELKDWEERGRTVHTDLGFHMYETSVTE